MEVRLQKYLADCGVASRRKCEEIILSGRVKVDDITVEELGVKVNPAINVVTLNDTVIKKSEDLVYILLHKPEGYITAVTDQFDRPTVIDLLDIEERVFPVGRLDYETSGLLLLTNDGELTFKLTHPKHEVKKTYLAKVMGHPTEESLEQFRKGLFIDGYKTSKAEVYKTREDEKYSWLKIVIIEGKNRQVRKMCDAIGHKVANLKRLSTGDLELGNLKRGEYRNLTKEEIEYLQNL